VEHTVKPHTENLGIDNRIETLSPRAAYNLVAGTYDRWHWQEFWRRNEVPLVHQYIEKIVQTHRVLDIGTGTGLYAELMALRSSYVTGVDISEQMLGVAQARVGMSVSLIQADVEALPIKKETFDFVIAARVFSHVDDLSQGMREVARVVRDGGYFILTDVDSRHDYRATRILTDNRMIYIDTHKWTEAQIRNVATSVGFTLKKAKRLTAKNLKWLPDSPLFHSIDQSGSRPISRMFVFRRKHR
jgi:ubiquinone/menaquinone biosynthesis C-methylase UbiE